MVRVVINGAAGRMGQRLVALISQDNGLQLRAAVEATGHSQLGMDAGTLAGVEPLSVPITDQYPGSADVVIDFSVPAGTRRAIHACVQTKAALVIGTTGLSGDDHQAIDDAAKTVAVLQAPNMSLGVNLLFALCAQVAKQLGDDYDIEITETHHRFKLDAPSGTALAMAKAICDATGRDFDGDVVYGRYGDEVPRKRGQIGMHAIRGGDVVGRHTAGFATLGEELQLTHIASSRDVFARGALRAAVWLAAKSPGRYTMADVLGL